MRSAIFLICLFLAGSAFSTAFIESDEGHIGVGADNVGMFSIGVPPSPPEHPEIRFLLNTNYSSASPAGAYIGFYIDSTIYTASGLLWTMNMDSAVYLAHHQLSGSHVDYINKWVITEWFIEDDPFGNDSIYITQVLQPQESGGSGTVAMKWIIRNAGSVPHDIGIILFMDTKINENDAAKIWGPGIPFSDTARVLPDPIHGWDIPDFWSAYEYDPPDDILGLVSKAILGTPPNTMPDKIAFADQRDLLEVYWREDIEEEPYYDSGVMMWWNPRTVQPDSLLTIHTSYGLADSSASFGGIYGLSIAYPRNLTVAGCELRPNPVNLVVGVTNNSDSVVTDMQAYIDFSGSDYCTLAPGEIEIKDVVPTLLAPGQTGFTNWSVLISPLPETTFTDYFQIAGISVLADTQSISPSMPIIIQGSDYLGPLAEIYEPFFGAVSSDSMQPIKIYLADDDVGVDTTRIFFYFIYSMDDSIGIDISDPRLSYGNDTLSFFTDAPYVSGRNYFFRLTRAEDLNGCPTDSVVNGNFLCDLDGPVINGHFPPDSTIQTDSLLANYVLCADMLGDLMLASVDYNLIIDTHPAGVAILGSDAASGVSIGISTGIAGAADSVFWKPAEWSGGLGHIPDGYVTINLENITDDPDYGIPNPSPDVPHPWWYLMNAHGPRAHPVLPDDGDYVSVPDTDVVYYLYDGNSIDIPTAFVEFDGDTFTLTSGSRDSLRTIPVSPGFVDGYLVDVGILAADDSLGSPLDVASHTEWSYTIDISAPTICDCSPAGGDTVGINIFDMSICLADLYAGVDYDNLTIWIDGTLVTLLTIDTGYVHFEVIATGDSAIVHLLVCDNIDVGPANWLDTNLVIYIVMEGPRAYYDHSADGFICSATGPIIWSLFDPDGIVDSTIAVTVNAVAYTTDDPELSYNATAAQLTFTPASAWTDAFFVIASLDAVEDVFGYGLVVPVDGSWMVDLEGPEWSDIIEEGHVSTGGSTYDMLDSVLHIHFAWGDGAIDSISLMVNSLYFTLDSMGLSCDDSLISFSSPLAGFALDSGVTYTLVLAVKTVCAFSEGEWDTHTVVLYSTDIDEFDSRFPKIAILHPNRPDPFNAATVIPFSIPAEGEVRLDISDILGRHVATLIDNRVEAGYHEITWRGLDDLGRELPSGIYNCRLITSDGAVTQRITLIR